MVYLYSKERKGQKMANKKFRKPVELTLTGILAMLVLSLISIDNFEFSWKMIIVLIIWVNIIVFLHKVLRKWGRNYTF